MSSPSSSSIPPMPAIKVGGRRHSVSKNKHARSASRDTGKAQDTATPPEYPRPAEGEAHDEAPQQDEQAKREKNKRAEFNQAPQQKWVDMSHKKTSNSFGGAGRISQPAGKTMPS
ncbi:hypothetical protein PIIN_04070 [Serendipita indica DSM 11827]|uniref:Uncharacterized protein n=1 Tax=Serendipita indica (strain DSM 11827) TaxID=1109443 RepID=G4TFQ0_SERID|nr:hypothetical protein PIIN_04070 [Serendipita indica DSM 11827]